MSDTHGNRTLMHRVADEMRDRFRTDVIYHLGDDFRDAEELGFAGHMVRYVPGLWCREYHEPRVPMRLIDDVDGLRVACVHAERDLRAVERAAEIVLFGHTHTAGVIKLGRTLYVNPGHLKAPVSRGERASFAIIEVGPEAVRAAIHEASGGILRESLKVSRADLG
ncbi:MAG: hypothetical protein GWP08_03920 [Nitrospiraceae bacterium]|nr:hypothetical protein [Nitrospiraceae bacterium]